MRQRRKTSVAEGLSIWNYGVMQSNGDRTSSSILRSGAAWPARRCVRVMMGLVCVIPGSFVETGVPVGLDLVRYGF